MIQVITAKPGSNLTLARDVDGALHEGPLAVHSPTALVYFFQIFFLFFANFLIFMGPLLLMGISQIRGFEPGDAEWGVKLDHVRGQAEAKEEIRRVVTLWQSGEVFEGAGGKRERGLLFLGAPGTGKTMMAKAIATGFNSPFVSIPGSGFAQTFIGIDAVIVRFLARKAKKLATQVGRPVHRLHRRDRRRRHAPQRADRSGPGRQLDHQPARRSGSSSTTGRWARPTRAAT